MHQKLEGLVWLVRDLLAAAGAYALLADLGHPNTGGGVAFIIAGVAVASRLSGTYSPGDAGSLPHPWE